VVGETLFVLNVEIIILLLKQRVVGGEIKAIMPIIMVQ
jgi:hypothetical protein